MAVTQKEIEAGAEALNEWDFLRGRTARSIREKMARDVLVAAEKVRDR